MTVDMSKKSGNTKRKSLGEFGINPKDTGYNGSDSLRNMAPPPDINRWESRTRSLRLR